MTIGQERDVNIRKVISEDLNNTRRNLQQFIEFLPSDYQEDTIDTVQRLLLDLRNLDKKINLSPVGDTYKLKLDPTREALMNRELRTFDKELSHKSSVLAKATSTLNDMMLDGKVKNITMELNKIRKYVSDLRNDVEHRDDIIKGVKF
ncbi:MAG: hypothetical protein ACMUIE_09240 [Thermoplasmatota archaeon]